MRFNWAENEFDRGITKYSAFLHGVLVGSFIHVAGRRADLSVDEKKAQLEKTLTQWVELVFEDYTSEPRPENHPDLFPADRVPSETPGSGIDKPPS